MEGLYRLGDLVVTVGAVLVGVGIIDPPSDRAIAAIALWAMSEGFGANAGVHAIKRALRMVPGLTTLGIIRRMR